MALIVNSKFCKGCGICVYFCPKDVLVLDDVGKIQVKEEKNCILCGQCELRCPDYALKVVKETENQTPLAAKEG